MYVRASQTTKRACCRRVDRVSAADSSHRYVRVRTTLVRVCEHIYLTPHDPGTRMRVHGELHVDQLCRTIFSNLENTQHVRTYHLHNDPPLSVRTSVWRWSNAESHEESRAPKIAVAVCVVVAANANRTARPGCPTALRANAMGDDLVDIARLSLITLAEVLDDDSSSVETVKRVCERLTQIVTCLLYTSPSPRDRG